MSTIHPTAVIDAGAALADDVNIGPMCYVGPHAVIGAGTRLVSHVAILGRTTLGEHNTIWPHTTLGADPQDLKYHGEETELIVGDRNEIRENVTMHLGTAVGGGVTRVGSDNLIMVGAHVAHDCELGSHLVVANAVQMAGHVVVRDHAVLSGACAIHHCVTIGQYAMVGGLTRIVQDVPPFMITEGNPARVRNLNRILLQRHHFPESTIEALKDAYKLLYRGDSDGAVGNVNQSIAELEAAYPDVDAIGTLIAFVRNSAAGKHGRFGESIRQDDLRTNPVR